jgi:hypothetical protein
MDEWHYLGAESDYHKIHYASQQSKAMGIELHATDGSGHFRIPAGKDKGKVLDENGFYDYYAEASYDNQAHWRKKLGEFAMKWLLHPSVGASALFSPRPLLHAGCSPHISFEPRHVHFEETSSRVQTLYPL